MPTKPGEPSANSIAQPPARVSEVSCEASLAMRTSDSDASSGLQAHGTPRSVNGTRISEKPGQYTDATRPDSEAISQRSM